MQEELVVVASALDVVDVVEVVSVTASLHRQILPSGVNPPLRQYGVAPLAQLCSLQSLSEVQLTSVLDASALEVVTVVEDFLEVVDVDKVVADAVVDSAVSQGILQL